MKSRLSHFVVLMLLLCFRGTAAVFYVDANSTNPIPPYTNWATAANVLQNAVDAASPGDTVLVTNGIYSTGGRKVESYDVTNCVAITNGAIVQSVNGPAATFIQGFQVPTMATISNAVRCVYLGSNSILSGFTLTNGSAGSGNYINGGGAFCTSSKSCVISNCVFVGNYAGGAGGGVERGTLIRCALYRNYGVGAASDATLINCTLTNNWAGWAAGTYACVATNCLIAFNHATNFGGGSAFSTLVNCTVVSNSLQSGSGGNGGGSYHDTVYNSIVFGNTAPNGPNYFSSGFAYSCTTPLPAGTGNFSYSPTFVNPSAGDFHSQGNSPCLNAGLNSYMASTTDLDGNPRISGGTVDVGAYEFQDPASIISYYWLQYYGLPTNGSADFADNDGDGMNNYQEWRAGTNPRDPNSVLKMAAPSHDASGLTVSWQSASGIRYYLQRSTNSPADPDFLSIQSNIVGQVGTTSYKDTNAVGVSAGFYRVGVQ